MIVFELAGRDAIVKRTSNCDYCEKQVSEYPIFISIANAEGKPCVVPIAPVGNLVHLIQIDPSDITCYLIGIAE